MLWLAFIFALILVVGIAVYVSVMWPSPLLSGQGEMRIACVGDSITYSLGVLGRRKKWSYPAVLAKLLGERYSTVNYGLSDRTLLSTADKPYFCEKLGKAAWDAGEQTVIFMLGSNDCKRKNWNAERFAEEYEAAIRHYLDGGHRLIVMIPPQIFYGKAGKSGYDAGILKKELIPIVRNLADRYAILCIDLYTLTAGHPEWFPDKLHPNRQGNVAIARQIAMQMQKKQS